MICSPCPPRAALHRLSHPLLRCSSSSSSSSAAAHTPLLAAATCCCCCRFPARPWALAPRRAISTHRYPGPPAHREAAARSTRSTLSSTLPFLRPFSTTLAHLSTRTDGNTTPSFSETSQAGAEDPLSSHAPGTPPRRAGSGTHFGPGLVGTVGSLHSKSGLLLRCTIFDRNGTARIVSGTFDKSTLCAENGLEMRDLRKIDSRVPNVVPTILARRGAFLVNMLHIRALVKHDTVLLFDG